MVKANRGEDEDFYFFALLTSHFGFSEYPSHLPIDQHENSKTQNKKKSEYLDPSLDYSEVLKEKLNNFVKILDPDFDSPIVAEITMNNDKKFTLRVTCHYCKSKYSLSAYQSGGYTRYMFKSFEKHIMSRHETLRNRLIEYKEKLQVKLTSIENV